MPDYTDSKIKECKKVLAGDSCNVNALTEIACYYYLHENNPQKALEYYKKLVEIEPENTNIKVCLGLCYLKTKNYEQGWKYFEYRLKEYDPNDSTRRVGLLSHQQKALTKKTIYVFSERGFGDSIMFARFLPELATKCKKVLFTPKKELKTLFENSNLNCEFVERTPDLKFDFYTSIMSLPYILNLKTEDDIAFKTKYLNSDSKKIEEYKIKYFSNKNLKVGINWQGDMRDSERAIPFANFKSLLDLNGVDFYSLQVGAEINDINGTKIIDLGSSFKDFLDTAAAIENLDLVITNDTSLAHLAGALDKKCFVLLPFVQDWRWSTDLSYCPWYKSVKLFKQTNPDSWEDVFEKVKTELPTFLL